MFTGIIQGLGEIASIRRQGHEMRLTVKPLFEMANIQDGESIDLNGVCLSVEKHVGNSFVAYASAETISRSTLGQLGQGAKVNLERALALGERFGGHIVSGHVDCVATVTNVRRQSQSLGIRIDFPREFATQVVKKGSVALDGISLTVNGCGSDFLEVNVIPDSQKRTNISQWRPGGKVNMETDVIGKYVQRLLAPWENPPLNRDFLAIHGFI